jgi:hypothetical protein
MSFIVFNETKNQEAVMQSKPDTVVPMALNDMGVIDDAIL